MTQTLLGICIGIILGITIEKYIFPILDIKFDVYQLKLNNIATKYHLNSQEKNILFNKKYPEFQQTNSQPELSPAIGFVLHSDNDCEVYEDKKIGFVNENKRRI